MEITFWHEDVKEEFEQKMKAYQLEMRSNVFRYMGGPYDEDLWTKANEEALGRVNRPVETKIIVLQRRLAEI